ncbi:MAG TPA: MFS transporter, partial [Chthoniobacterales bacterium]|nr:MFS transporter [Chthoniobacterales bacterium]
VISVNLVLFGLIGPFAVGLVQRFGPRQIMVVSLGLLGIGVALTAFVNRLEQLLLLWGILIGTGTGMSAIVLGATVVHRWFDRHRGAVLGVLSASTATGQLLFLPLLANLAVQHGWRAATWTVACVIALFLPVVALLMRNTPRELGLHRLGSDQDETEPAGENPIIAALRALSDATRNPAFWLLAGSFFVCGASTNGLVGTHLIPACIDHGFSEVHGANLLAAMGVCDLVGTILSGWLSDRFNNRWLLFFYYGLRGLSLLLLPWSFDLQSFKLPLFAVFYGLDWIATVPPTVALAAQIFGRERVGLVFGWIFAAHQLGAAAAASFAGMLRTLEGTYDHAFLISGNLCIITAVAILFISVRPDCDRAIRRKPDPVAAV